MNVLATGEAETLENIIKNNFGYEILDCREFGNGLYRPKVQFLDNKISRDLEIRRIKPGTYYIKDYAEKLLRFLYVTVKQNDTSVFCKSKEVTWDPNKSREDRLAAFMEEYKIYSEAIRQSLKNHPLWAAKKLNYLSGYRVRVATDVKSKTSTLQGTISDVVVVPFSFLDQGVCGAQLRFSTEYKRSVIGSSFTDLANNSVAFHKVSDHLKGSPIFVSESFTTACQMSEMFPAHGCYCVVGQSHIIKGYENLCEHFPESTIIAVLDKNKKSNAGCSRYSKTEHIIDHFRKNRLPHVLPPEDIPEIYDATDFNDMRCILGFYTVQIYIIDQVKEGFDCGRFK